MTRDEVQRLFDLARRLGSTPRRILVEAARMADGDAADIADSLQAIRRHGSRHDPACDACANLLLAPVASVARDSLDNALGTLWHAPEQAEK